MENVESTYFGRLLPTYKTSSWLLTDIPEIIDFGGFDNSKFPFFPNLRMMFFSCFRPGSA